MTGFERLAQRIKNRSRKLRRLIQEQHAVM